MLHIVLLEPEIPQNTGNISRTCAALGARLHLIEPLGFSLDDRSLKRAGLDYWPLVDKEVHPSLEEFYRAQGLSAPGEKPGAGNGGTKVFYLSARAKKLYTAVKFPEEVFFVFGRESTGLPSGLLAAAAPRCIRIPMLPGLRSLNLSNSVAIIAYEYARRRRFPQCTNYSV
jgi:tRNA (cytidine/uridine-2'-O-)-methyltransferase